MARSGLNVATILETFIPKFKTPHNLRYIPQVRGIGLSETHGVPPATGHPGSSLGRTSSMDMVVTRFRVKGLGFRV